MKNFLIVSTSSVLLLLGCNGADFSGSTARTKTLASKDVASKATTGEIQLPPVPPSQEPPGPAPVKDPLTSQLDLAVEASTTKPLTHLYLIVDNSFSMTPVQAKMATTIERLMRQIAAENLNVNLNLYTSTDMIPAVPPMFTLTEGGSSFSTGLHYTSYGAHGDKGNSDYGARTFYEIVNGVKQSIASPGARSGNTFWLSDEMVLGKSKFISGDGILKFRENMSAADAAQLANQAASTISNLGTAGSDREQSIAALYRISRQIPVGSSDRYAFGIVTNEDDFTMKGVLLAHDAEIKSQNQGALYTNIYATQLRYEYERYQPERSVDGVVVDPAQWIRSMYYLNEMKCKSNTLCNAQSTLNQNVACRPDQIEKMQATVAASPGSAREAANPTCTAFMHETVIDVRYTDNAQDTCDSIEPSTGKSYRESFIAARSDELFGEICRKHETAKFVVSGEKRVTELVPNGIEELGSAEVGDLFLSNMTKAAGAKGFSVALIANDGVQSCGQSDFGNATRLGQFLAKTPNPNLRMSLCADDYQPVAKGLKDFIATVAKRNYKFSQDPAKIKSVIVKGAGGGERTIASTDYAVANGQIEFRPGVLEVGDQVKFTMIE